MGRALRWVGAVALSVAVFSVPAGSPAFAGVPAALGNVSDYVGTLTPGQRARIDDMGERLVHAGVKLAVAVIDTAAPATPKEWAVEAFSKWGVGDAGKDNGVLVLLATGDRRVEIEVGYGLEDRLTDSQAGRLLDRHAVPHFRQNAWGEGVVALVEGMAMHFGAAAGPVERPLRAHAGRPERRTGVVYGGAPSRRTSSGGGIGSGLVGVLGLLLAACLFLLNPYNVPVTLSLVWVVWAWSLPLRHLFVNRRFLALGCGLYLYDIVYALASGGLEPVMGGVLLKTFLGVPFALYTLTRRCPRCSVGYLDVSSRILRSATTYSTGLEEITRDCPACPFHDVDHDVIPRYSPPSSSSSSSSSSSWSSSSSSSSWSSSSSSFGGGSSGGGGAGRSF